MVEVAGRPVLWHILKMYSAHGICDFVICAGYKGYVIKEYFANYFLHMSDVTFDIAFNTMTVHERKAEPWKVTLALISVGLTLLLWINGLLESLQRPSVGNTLNQRQLELAVLAAPQLPANLRAPLVG
jgi:hypothetical protein